MQSRRLLRCSSSLPITDNNHSDLFLRYSMDAADRAGSIILDKSPNARNTSVSGNPTSVTGLLGEALRGDGIDDGIIIPTTLASFSEMTLIYWIKNEASLGVALGGQRIEHLNGWFRFYSQLSADGSAEIGYRDITSGDTGTAKIVNAPAVWSGNVGWTMLGVRMSALGNFAKIWINGADTGASSTFNGFSATSAVTPGTGLFKFSSVNFGKGAVDQYSILTRSLSDSEMLAFWNGGLGI